MRYTEKTRRHTYISLFIVGWFLLSSSCPLMEACHCEAENCGNLASAAYDQEVANCWWWQSSCYDQAHANLDNAHNWCLIQYEYCLMVASGLI